MSGNQKQTAGGGPQSQRYSNTIYQPISQQQRTEGFHVQTQPYVPPQQPNQPGNQAQTLRGIAPTGPPNQASTPPTNDLKVPTVQQQQSMNHMYAPPQQQVRGTQGTYFRSVAPNQAARMPNQHRGQQQIYPPQAAQYMSMPVPTQMYITNTMQYYNGQRPQAIMQPGTPYVYQTQPFPSQFALPPNPSQAPAVPFPYYAMRPSHQSAPSATVPSNASQPLQNLPITQAPPPFTRQQNRRRPNAIAIIHPDTGVDRLDEVYEQQNSSHPPSGESSARQTPQPSVNNVNKEIQVTFAKQVYQVATNETSIDDQDIHAGSLEHEALYHHANAQQGVGQAATIDHLVQSSTLKAQAKEFVLCPAAKETTPIVSANCDSVEVTLPNKQIKDRESPAKGRKQKEQSREHKVDLTVKDTAIRDKVSDKEASSTIKNDSSNKAKDTVLPGAIVATAAATAVSAQSQTVTIKDNKEVVTQRDDKKIQKKESKNDTIVPNVEVNDSASVQTNQPLPQEAPSNAKSKNNAQRTKDGQQKQQQQQQQQQPQQQQQQQLSSGGNNQKQPATAPVPAPQPSKASSKSSKKTELNQKGANKEGTDMDAFNDNVHLDNANVNVNNEINANSVVNTNNANVPANDINKKSIAEPTTIRTETAKTLPKSKIDVTDIVKEKPKPIKSFPPAATTGTQDEIDRAAPSSNDKLVQAKNEVNAKANAENSSAAVIDTKSQLPYREGQWTPFNKDGKRVYDREFLLALRDDPASRKKPDNLPDIILADDRGRLSDGRYSMGGGRTDIANIPFSNYGGKSSSQRGPPPKRNSQSGKLGGGGGKGSKSALIKVSISVREDVKLHEAENAWKPARFQKGESQTDEEHKTEELYKKVRGVLNKLTPQKFETLVSQVRELQIETVERLQGVIDLVFEKAVDEPNFSVAYALMCRELAMMQVPPVNPTGDDLKDGINFRKLLITRCQMEFEKQSSDETIRNEKVSEIEKCTDAEKRKELQFELEEHERKLRMKSVGNIRFIGELFKQQMLTVNIMLRCLDNLLEHRDEEGLECLCKLLTTIGKDLESKNINLSNIFITMKDIVEKKDAKISSRVRFMLQDVLDLRRNKWIPRRQDSNPKTIDQIQKEAENEQLNIQVMNAVPLTPRKDDRGGSTGANSDRKRRNVSDDGWQTPSSRSRGTPFSVSSDKLKATLPHNEEPLGCRSAFNIWSKGSNIKTETNKYAALEHFTDIEKRLPGLRSGKDPYSSKGPSLERTYKQSSYDGRGSRSGSQHRSADRDSSSSSVPKVQPAATSSSVTSAQKPAQPVQAAVPQTVTYTLTDDQLDRHVTNSLDEYLNDNLTIEEYSQDTQTTVPASYLPTLVINGISHVLERSATARVRTGLLFTNLIQMGTLSMEDYCIGLEDILKQGDDLTIDIPKFWSYLAETLLHIICEKVLSLSRLHKLSEAIISKGLGPKLLGELFKLIVSQKGPNFLSGCWRESGLSFTDFMDASSVESFVKDNKLEFLCGGDTAAGQSQLTYEQIHNKLVHFFSAKASFDDIVNWITANVGELVKENRFVRTLMTAIFESSISRQKLVPDNLKDHYKLLQKYVDNNPNYELQCLYALQVLIQKLEHPKGLLLTICDQLYEDAIISQDSFIAWEASTDPAELDGKGVALKQLTCFFTQLKENEEESGSSSDET